MPFRWKIFRLICLVQILITSVLGLISLYRIFTGSYPALASLAVLCLIMALASLGISLVNNNYPDTPVTGKQKKIFNRLYLINFLSLIFLFAFVFADFRQFKEVKKVFADYNVSVPITVYMGIIADTLVLVAQLYILYGLYELRRELYINFVQNKFEFEKNPEPNY